MSDRTITLQPRHLPLLHNKSPVYWDDNEGREVLLLPDGADPSETYDGLPIIALRPGDADLIESEPDGLLVLKLPIGQPDSSYVIEVER